MKINWKRIVGVIAGAAPVLAAYEHMLPPWVAVPGAIVMGLAVNAERIFAKREKGAPVFDGKKAREMAGLK